MSRPHLLFLRRAGLVCIALLGCDLGDGATPAAAADPCRGVTWPAASGAVTRVASCGRDTGDGSAARPYLTISAALAVAKPGSTVVVAKGTYAESLAVAAGVSLAGSGLLEVTLAPPGKAGIVITGKGHTRIAGLRVTGAVGAGVSVQDSAVTLVSVRIEKTKADTTPGSGHGVSATQPAALVLEGCQLIDNEGVGLVAARASGAVSIVDPLFLKDPKATARGNGTVGIVDPLFLPASLVKGNLSGGIAIVDPLFVPTPGGPQALRLAGTDVADNGLFGVQLNGAGASIEATALRGTKAGKLGGGDGLQLALATKGATPAATVRLDARSIVTGNARAGVAVFSAAATVDVEAEVSLAGRAGVWAEGAQTTIRVLQAALLADNGLVGVAVKAGATLEMSGGRISGTRPVKVAAANGGAPFEMADGIGIYGQAHARISGAKLDANPRAGILARQCAANGLGLPDVEVTSTSISGSKYGIVVNGTYSQSDEAAAAQAAPKSAGNSYDGVASESADDELPVAEGL